MINYNHGGDIYPYLGISYNPSNGLLYVAALGLKEIQVLNLDLTLIRRSSTSPHMPFSITISSNKLYVGTYGGMILVYQNESLIYQFNGCNGNSDRVMSILFDPNGYMATTCWNPTDTLYLFSPDGSFTGKSIKKFKRPIYYNFMVSNHNLQLKVEKIQNYYLYLLQCFFFHKFVYLFFNYILILK